MLANIDCESQAAKLFKTNAVTYVLLVIKMVPTTPHGTGVLSPRHLQTGVCVCVCALASHHIWGHLQAKSVQFEDTPLTSEDISVSSDF